MAKPDSNPDLPDVTDEVDEQEDDVLDDDLDTDDTSDEGDGDEGDGDEDDAEDGDDEKPLGPKGEKALAAMKATLKETKKALREANAKIADLSKSGDDDEDELTSAKKATETEREKRIEAEKKLAAKMHGLPDSWADRLKGDDFDDFLDDAEALAEDMPTPRSRKGGGGAKEGTRKRKEPSLDDQIAEAEKEGDFATARRLKAQKIHALRG